MAVVLVEGFDHVQDVGLKNWIYESWDTGQNVGSYVLGTGRVTGKCLEVHAKAYTNTPVQTRVRKALPGTYTELIVGVGIYRPTPGWSAGADDYTMTLQLLTNAGGLIAALMFDSSNRPYVWNGSTSVASSSTIIGDNTWHYYELRIKVNGASGECELYVDGASDIATTTGNFGSTAIAQIGLNTYGNGSFGGDDDRRNWYDDVYAVDLTGPAPRNTFLGDCRVETIFPDADGANLNWTPDTGVTHYSRVNEASGTFPDSDTSYVTSNTAGDKDTYSCNNLSTATGNIHGVQVSITAKKTTAGYKEIKALARRSGVDYEGASKVLTTSYVTNSHLFETDPSGGVWTVNKINTGEFGVEVVV